jgi:zinc and cadmium transporter
VQFGVEWIYTLGSVVVISLISLVGIFSLFFKRKGMDKNILFLVSFSAGSLFGGAFLHLLPETIGEFGFGLNIQIFFILGILSFFVIEKFIHWRHCHIPTSDDHPHAFAYMNLVGDAIHNFIDGLVIGASYLVNIPLGISTTLAVIFHEIPQEIGDFWVLVYGGFKKTKALLLNFLTATTAILGAIVGLLVGAKSGSFITFILPFTAGGFIYIAGSDLIPELNKECELSRSLLQLLGLVLGIAVMTLLLFVE